MKKLLIMIGAMALTLTLSMAEGKCEGGKCDAAKKAETKCDAAKKAAAKCDAAKKAAAKCDAAKKDAKKGKCGEGKCGK